MAEENRIIEARIGLDLSARYSAGWSATFGHTGRAVRGNEGYAFAAEWAGLQTREELLDHQACQEFSRLAQLAPRVSNASLVFFRGCRGPGQIGPPPQECAPIDGRYNCQGQPVLYLTDSEEGVRREFSFSQEIGRLYIQRYRLPLDQLRIADFSKIPEDHFLAAVFSLAENCNVDGRGANSYTFSQTVAELVAARFDGMLVPGVRGNSDAHYNNVVVFRPHPNWPAWLEPGSDLYLFPGRAGSAA